MDSSAYISWNYLPVHFKSKQTKFNFTTSEYNTNTSNVWKYSFLC